MMTAYFIHKEDPDSVANTFSFFTKTFEEICSAFKDVTGKDITNGANATAVEKSCEALKQKIADKENHERYFKLCFEKDCKTLCLGLIQKCSHFSTE